MLSVFTRRIGSNDEDRGNALRISSARRYAMGRFLVVGLRPFTQGFVFGGNSLRIAE